MYGRLRKNAYICNTEKETKQLNIKVMVKNGIIAKMSTVEGTKAKQQNYFISVWVEVRVTNGLVKPFTSKQLKEVYYI